MKNAFLLLVFLLVCALPADIIVSGGAPTDNAVFDSAHWHAAGGRFTGEGQGCPLASRQAYATRGLRVKATLALERMEGTAAGIGFGNFLFGFDGGKNRGLFIEDSAGNVIHLAPLSTPLAPNTEFTAEITCDNGRASCFINGKNVGQAACGDGPEAVFIRPWRNTVHIREFTVDGIRAGIADSDDPIITHVINILSDARIQLPPPRTVTGACLATLTALSESAGAPAAFDAVVSEDGTITLPAAHLQAACAAAHLPYALRPLALELKSGTASCRYLLTATVKFPNNLFAQGRVVHTEAGNRFAVNGASIGLPTGVLISHNGVLNLKGARRFGQIGVHGKILHLAPWKFWRDGAFDATAFAADLEALAVKIIVNDPLATLMLQFELYMPPEWCDSHPDELIVLDNGADTLANAPLQKRQPSYASRLWRQTAADMLQDAIAALAKTSVADRIWYFKLLYANCGEWNHWGYHEQAYVDLSAPMNREFAQWLRLKYHTEHDLQNAWQNPGISFGSTALVPGRDARRAGGDIFRGPSGPARQAADYYEFFQQFAAQTIAGFARTAKQASGGAFVVGAYYGYYFGHFGLNYHFQDSGNYGVHTLLSNPSIDFIGAPDIYSDRRSVAPLNGVTASLERAGKLWESEDDYRTHLALGPRHRELGATADLAETCQQLKRNFAAAIANRTCFYYFDFAKDWYQNTEAMDTIQRLRKLNERLENLPRQNAPRIALVFSEKITAELSSIVQPAILASGRIPALQFPLLGIPCDRFLLEDIQNLDFTQYAAVVFFNAFRLTDQQRHIIRTRAATSHRHLVFLYAPDMLDGNGKFAPARCADLTGIHADIQPDSPYATLAFGKTPSQKPDRPCRTIILDDGLDVHARHADGAVAAATRTTPNASFTLVCDIAPDIIFWRSLFTRLGIPFHTSGIGSLDQAAIAWPFVAVSRFGKHATKPFWLHHKAEIAADLDTGKTIGQNMTTLTLDFSQPSETKLLYIGTRKGLDALLKK